MVFQNYALFPHMNVEQNIGYSLKLKGRPKPEIKKTVAGALALVRLSGYEKRMPDELSGGQRQRVAVARAVVNRPKVLLLDEPLGALDLQLRRQMQIELNGLQQRLGITFIEITHDQEEALTMSDRIAVMRNGLFEQIGSAVEVYDRPKTGFVARFVGGANVLEGTVISRENRDGGRVFLEFEHPSGRGGLEYGPGGGERDLGTGQKIRLAIRGEYIDFRGGEGPGLAAVITGKSFAGGQLRITARLKNTGDGPESGGAEGRDSFRAGEISASRGGIDSPLSIGDEVRVSWAPGRAVLVDAEPDGAGR
jgi:spermidine/putrescine transport system ATP-binding protein